MGEFFVNVGKFILGAIIKTVVLTLAVLLIWLIICIIYNNGFKEGVVKFLGSGLTAFVAGWFVYSFECITSGDIQQTVIGILLFFIPIILLSFCTPNPDIELYDNQGNLWTLHKN